jgi:hypothetical protein
MDLRSKTMTFGRRADPNSGAYVPEGDFEDTSSSIGGQIRDAVTGESEEDRARRRRAVNEQIKSYREQTEITRKELAAKKDEQAAEKRRIEEKQIRALRRNYTAQGFLGTQPSGQADMSSKLGG